MLHDTFQDIIDLITSSVTSIFGIQASIWSQYPSILPTFLFVFAFAVFFRFILSRIAGGQSSGSDSVGNKKGDM